MAQQVDKYRVWCTVDSKWVFVWSDIEPTVCPENITHAIDTSKTSIVDSIKDEEDRDTSNRLRIHETSRPIGTKTYFTSVGDDDSAPEKVGNGSMIQHDHIIGAAANESKYIDYNMADNETWVHEGYLFWNNCKLDKISLEIVPRVTATSSGANTNYNLYGGYLITPAAGDGTLSLDNDMTSETHGLIYMPDDDDGNQPVAYWNADWNSTTKLYENITAAPLGDGRYNMFSVEIIFDRFISKVCMTNSGSIKMTSADTARVGAGMRFKLLTYTFGADHDWDFTGTLNLYRAKTV